MSSGAEVVLRITGNAKGALAAIDKTNSAVGTLDTTISRSADFIGKWAKRSALALTAAAAAAGAAILAIGSDYQGALNTFESVSSASADQMRDVGRVAKDLGNDLTLPGTSAADAAFAMTELAKGGLSVADSMAAAKGALQLAIGAQLDEARAAEVVAGALNAFNLAGDQAVRVADLLAAASVSASGEVVDMADAYKMAATVWNSAGFQIEELTAAVALMAKQGILGSDAGTSLKTMVMRLTAPTDEAAAAMKALGIRVFDAQGAMRPMREIVGQFARATADMTTEQRAAALATIFGADAVRAANIVLQSGTEAWDEMTTSVTRAGAAAELAAAKSKGITGALDSIKSTIETAFIGAFEFVAPSIESFLRGVGVSLTMLADDPAWQRFTKHAKQAFQPILDTIDRVGQAMQQGGFRAGMEEMRRTIEDTLGGIHWPGVLARITGGLEAAPDVVTRFSSFLLSTLLSALEATDWAGLSERVTGLLTRMMIAVDWGLLVEAATNLLVQTAPRIIDGFIMGVFRAATDNPIDFLLLLLALGFTPAKVIKAVASALGRIPILGPIAGWLLTGFARAGAFIIGPIVRLFSRLGRSVMAGLKAGVTSFWDELIVPFFRGVGRRILTAIGNLGRLLYETGRSIIRGLWDGMKDAASGMLNWVGGLAGRIRDLKGPISKDRRLLEPEGAAIMQGLMAGLASQEAALVAQLRGITGTIGAVGGAASISLATPVPDRSTASAPVLDIDYDRLAAAIVGALPDNAGTQQVNMTFETGGREVVPADVVRAGRQVAAQLRGLG